MRDHSTMAVLVWVALAIFALVVLAASYARWVKAWHGGDRADFPGNAVELARAILDEEGLAEVPIARSDHDDGFQAEPTIIWLRREVLEGRSITAIALAVHQVAHAAQHRDGLAMVGRREGWEKALLVIATAVAFWMIIVSGGSTGWILAGAAGLSALLTLCAVLVKLRSLPLEWDASFRRATLMLGRRLSPRDLRRARGVLRAELVHEVTRGFFLVPRVAWQVETTSWGGWWPR